VGVILFLAVGVNTIIYRRAMEGAPMSPLLEVREIDKYYGSVNAFAGHLARRARRAGGRACSATTAPASPR